MLKNTQGQTLQKCARCHSVKLQEEFFSINVKGDYNKSCDKCLTSARNHNKKYRDRPEYKEKARQYRQNYFNKPGNREKEKNQKKEYRNRPEVKERSSQYHKQWYQDNKDKITEQERKYRKNNREKITARKKEYRNRPENKERLTQYYKQWAKQYRQDKRNYCEHETLKQTCKICSPLGHLKSLVARRIHQALNSINKTKDNGTIEYLGCDIDTFKNWIERQFTSEMTWDNMGDVWQIDHYVPVLYKMNGQSPRECDVIRRLHYMNTQPMLSWQNVSKGNRYIGRYKPDF